MLASRSCSCTTAALVRARSPSPAPRTTKPFAAFSNSAQSLRDSVVQMAKAQLGTRYRTGGADARKRASTAAASWLRDVGAQPRACRAPPSSRPSRASRVTKDTSRLLPGDLLTFGKTKKSTVSHVGIYVGDGRYIHASSVAGKVIESSIDRPFSPLIKVWRGARRMLSLGDSTAVGDSAAARRRPSASQGRRTSVIRAT